MASSLWIPESEKRKERIAANRTRICSADQDFDLLRMMSIDSAI